MNAVHLDILELAATAIDFELSPAERARLDDHMSTCDVCPRRVAGLHADDRVLADLPAFVLGPSVAERLQPSRRSLGGIGMVRIVAIGALLALLAAASLAVGAELLRREFNDRLTVVPTQPEPTGLQPEPSDASPSPVPSERAAMAWRSIGEVPVFAGAEIQAISFDADFNVLALGCTVAADATDSACADAVVWQSPDGAQWSEPTVLPIDPAETAFRLTAVARSGVRTFVGGSVARGDVFHAAIWSTDDGITWTRATSDPSFEGATVAAIVEFREGYVAVGSGLFTEPAGFRAWRSVDGIVWTPATELPSDEAAFASGILELEDDTLLAWGPLGSVAPLGTKWWASGDGETWASVAAPNGLDGAEVRTIERSERAFLAHGWRDGEIPVPTRWVRAVAGTDWREDATDPDFQDRVGDQVAVGGGTVGAALSGTGAAVTGVWYRGPEETGWREAVRIPDVEPLVLAQVPLDPARVVLIGRGTAGRTVVWTGAVDWLVPS